MNYWHIQLHPDDNDTISPKVVTKIINEKQVIGIGEWDNGQALVDQFENEMAIGDIVVIKNGATPIALVKVIGDYYKESVVNEEFDWFPHRRKIEILDFYKDEYKFYIPQARGTLSICRDLNNQTSQTIIKWFNMYSTNKIQTEATKVLMYKHQIILQGPPGTGKTRLAKLIADDLIKPKPVGNPMDIIDDFIKNFNPASENVITNRRDKDTLLTTFNEKFPKEKLNVLTLESYCVGKGERDTFCWWLERGLKTLGYYFPGSSRSFLIFWKKELLEYSKHGLLKAIDTNEEAMKKIASIIHEAVNTKNITEAVKYFGDGFLLKLMNSYYPDEYFPINSVRMIENALKIFSFDYNDLDAIEKNKKLNEIFLKKKSEFKSQINNFEFARFLFEHFNIKTGENIDTNQGIMAKGECELIQFHPAYTYEDFVRGIIAETIEAGNVSSISYNVVNKTLGNFAQKANDNPNGNYVLIIDEINRANLPTVLGELIYALEYRNEPVTSIYECDGERNITLPKNLYIIGTMNTADRSVGHIDYAIRRRFAFVNILPDDSVIQNVKAKVLFSEISKLFKQEFLSPDFKENEVKIGHSYFLVNNDDELRLKLDFEIKPILREYLKDGILVEKATVLVESLNV
jgi:5-methylcytosine-specific restriction protein B